MLIEIIKDKRYCPCFLWIAAINTMATAHSWRKGFIFLTRPSHSPPMREDRPATQSGEEAVVLRNVAHLLASSLIVGCLSHTSESPVPRAFTSISNQGNGPETTTQASLTEEVFYLRFSQSFSSLCQAGKHSRAQTYVTRFRKYT